MKLIILIIVVMCCLISASSQSAYNRSLQTWRRLKLNSYTYVVSWPQNYAHYGEETIIKVVKGKVVRREFRFNQDLIPWPNPNLIRWVETDTEIGSHDQGYPARTMEENYKYCNEEILPKQKYPNFQADTLGIFQKCTYTTNEGCPKPRSCFDGINILVTIID